MIFWLLIAAGVGFVGLCLALHGVWSAAVSADEADRKRRQPKDTKTDLDW